MKTDYRERKETYKVYIAEDGTQFTNEDQCRDYENTMDCVIGMKFKAIAKEIKVGKGYVDELMDAGRQESDYYIVEPSDDSEVNTILAYVRIHGGSLTKGNYILGAGDIKVGEKYIVMENECWGGVTSYKSLEEYYKRLFEETSKVLDGSYEKTDTE